MDNNHQIADAHPLAAAMGSRIKAVFIDMLILVALAFFLSEIKTAMGGEPYAGTILLALLFFYEPLLISLSGSTIGHFLLGIKVKRLQDKQRNINFYNACIRYLGKTMLGWLSFLTLFLNKDRRAVHDIISGSIVLVNKA